MRIDRVYKDHNIETNVWLTITLSNDFEDDQVFDYLLLT